MPAPSLWFDITTAATNDNSQCAWNLKRAFAVRPRKRNWDASTMSMHNRQKDESPRFGPARYSAEDFWGDLPSIRQFFHARPAWLYDAPHLREFTPVSQPKTP